MKPFPWKGGLAANLIAVKLASDAETCRPSSKAWEDCQGLHERGCEWCSLCTQAVWWANPSPLDDEDDAHTKEHKVVKEAGTPDGDQKSKKFDEG